MTKDGLVKPYDPSPVISKLEELERSRSLDLSELKKCCPPVAVINDAKDFKPYIMAVLEQFKDLMELEVRNEGRYDRR